MAKGELPGARLPNWGLVATILGAMEKQRADSRAIYAWLRTREGSIVRLLEHMVKIESPSHDKTAVDRMGALIAAEWKRRGARVTILRNGQRGNHVRAEISRGRSPSAGQILVLGHLDTVYPLGTLRRMPFRISSGRVFGPGTFDMKGGLAMALAAKDALRALRITTRRKLVFLWTSDEEIGSGSSHRAIEAEARRSKAVLVLEPAFGKDGRLKTQRKGVGEAEIIVTGRSAHAGIDPESGVNAVHELALQITRLRKLNNPRRGVAVQANVVDGGTASNVVPERASALVDLRVARASDVSALNRKLHALRPILRGSRIEIKGGVNRPPMERTPESRKLFSLAHSLAREIGFKLGEASTGGGSDGNFTAALGVPTLDGLGAVGEGAHSPRECVVLRALPQRAALLASLLASL
ncbi:MAG TPA: M20 family metallopeptidase [Candidatus Acidoferrales bacterium]|nr:M20 family metallopeptidase [Candidatus Acidoferrales bacterium]